MSAQSKSKSKSQSKSASSKSTRGKSTGSREPANVIRVEGRLSAPPEVKRLPSGDELVLLKVVVERPDGSRADSLPVAVGPAPPKGKRRRAGQAARTTVKRAAGLEESDVVRVEGWLQRRFWDAGAAGRRSRLQIVATDVRRSAIGP